MKNGSSYTEYYSNRSAKEAALEIAQAVGSSTVEAYSSNPVLYWYLKDFGEIRDMASMRIPGIVPVKKNFYFCLRTMRKPPP